MLINLKDIFQGKYSNQLIVISVSFLCLLFWESPLVYPIKLFIVLLHELNHVIATILTGGTVTSVGFYFDLSGITNTQGGNLIIIALSGYLGSLLLGYLLYSSSSNIKLQYWLCTLLGIVIILISVNLMVGGIQIFISLLIGIIFISIPRIFNKNLSFILLRIIGLTSLFYIVVDIKQDLLTSSLRETDTQVIEYLTRIPSFLSGSVIFLIALGIAYVLIKKSLKN